MSSGSQASSGGSRELAAILRNILVCYFLSGALGLVYEILWLRRLLLVFGSTVHAVSTVLTVFFGGLALGSWLFGRLIDRRGQVAGLRWYAALEAGIGLYAFATLPLFGLIERLYIPVYRASNFSPTVLVTASFLCAALILLLPATLLGGTFPILSRFLIRTGGERGTKLATLYAVNTAGAVIGTLGVYYVGLPMLGLSRTLICAGVLNLGIGGLCFLFDQHLGSLGFHRPAAAPEPAAEIRPQEDEPPASQRGLFFAFGLSGFAAMVYEVAWTRTLSLVLGSSIYAFCVILATFLAGMALGSFAVRSSLQRRRAELPDIIKLELLLGAYGLASVVLFNQLPDWFVVLWPAWGKSFATLSALQAALSAMAMLPPTLMMGALFPLVSDLATHRLSSLGRRLGSIYAINTLGGIIGSFLGGFVLIPQLGLPWAIVVAALFNLLAAASIFVTSATAARRSVRLGLSAAVLSASVGLSAMVLVPMWQREVFAAGVYLTPGEFAHSSVREVAERPTLLFYRDSLNATVSVHQQGRILSLKIGGKTDASNGIDMGSQILAAHLPLLLHHGEAHSVFVLGLGSGVTLGHAGRYPVKRLDCAEIDPAVVEAARLFKEYNYGIHDDPRVRIYAADGRNFLLASQRPYDVIISEPSNPWMAGLAYLFTQEFYQLAKRRLAPGGVMCQWLQLYRLFPADVKLVLRTFHAEFPYVTVWSSVPGDLLLIGSQEPLEIDFARLQQQMAQPAIRDSLRMAGVERPEALLQLLWLGPRELEAVTADTPWLHQDDQPSVEFNAPKALYLDANLPLNYAGLQRFRAPVQELVHGYQPPAVEDTALALSLARLWLFRDEQQLAEAELRGAVARDPGSVEAWRMLGELSLQNHRLLQADAAFRRAAQAAPGDPSAFQSLGRLNLSQGRFPEALEWYGQAVRFAPENANLAAEIGDAWQGAQQLAWAAEWYRSAISLSPQPVKTLWEASARTSRRLKAWSDAEAMGRSGAQLFPGDALFDLIAGEALLEQGRLPEAVDRFQRARAVAPKAVEVYYGLGRIALAQGQAVQAVRLLREGLRHEPYHHASLDLLSRLTQH